MNNYRIVVDNVLLQGNDIAVFSGINEKNKRVRCVTRKKVSPTVGDVYEVAGDWENDPKYGWQLGVTALELKKLSGRLIIPFLINTLPGVGPERANKLFDVFGERLGEILSSADGIEKIASVLNPQITPFAIRTAGLMYHAWVGKNTEFLTLEWLERHGVTDYATGRRVARILGAKAPGILGANPYILSSAITWPKMDKLGLPILRAKESCISPRRAPERLVGAVDSVMRDLIQNGHTAVPKNELPIFLAKKLDKSDDYAKRAIELGKNNSAIIDGGNYWRAPGCAFMEEDLKRRFQGMALGQESSRIKVPEADTLRAHIFDLMKGKGISLHPEQIDAAIKSLGGQIRIIRGGAGTGKTTIIMAIVETWLRLGGRVEMVALAGKAALRISQSTGRLARTIFRLLKAVNKGQMNLPIEEIPTLDDRTLLIVDEASMVDLGQWHQIHQAMPSGCRLLMVGDTAQLPPIGFGLVFHILAETEGITASLTTIHRQSEESGIPEVASAIRDRIMPDFKVYQGINSGVSFIDVPVSQIPCTVAGVVNDLGGFEDSDDIMICTALNTDASGVDGLNELFSSRRGRSVEEVAVKGFLGQWYMPNDPVIFLKNNYKEGLFNGSMGRVIHVFPSERKVIVNFDGEEKCIAREELLDLKLAYAITCHKAQGSQAKRVIIPITDTNLLDPSWLYTAVTRSEEQCVLVGDKKMLFEALQRPSASEKRHVGFTF